MELVGEAGSVKNAEQNILRLQPKVVLLGIKLSDDNGLDMLESLQVRGLKTRAIVMAPNPCNPCRERAMELGAIHFIDKAKELENIRGVLAQLLKNKKQLLKCRNDRLGEKKTCHRD